MTHRKRIATFGRRPHTVAVFSERTASGPYCRCQWRVKGHLLTKSFPDTGPGRREAKAFGETLALELAAPVTTTAEPLTLSQLWERFVAAEFGGLRAKTIRNYGDYWRKWIVFNGGARLAADVTRERIELYAKVLREMKIAVGQVARHVELVVRVLAFGVDRELIPPTKATSAKVKIGKDERAPETVEYRPEDALKIIAKLDPASPTQWRAWVFCVVAHYCGPRANALLHLQWPDIDREKATLRWRPEWDKQGHDRTQPAPSQVMVALGVAETWRLVDSYDGPWVFYSPQHRFRATRPATYGGINLMLHAAEARAGVVAVHMNAAHRFRRGAAGNVLDLTGGDIQRAMAWIGDTDLKMAKRYLKHRDERMEQVAALLSGPQSDTENATAPQPDAGEPS